MVFAEEASSLGQRRTLALFYFEADWWTQIQGPDRAVSCYRN